MAVDPILGPADPAPPDDKVDPPAGPADDKGLSERSQQYYDEFPNLVKTEEEPGQAGSGFKLPACIKASYAFPMLGYYAARYMRSLNMKKFYTDVVGVPLWWVAFAVVLAVAFDALSDPISGYLTDKTRCTFGGQFMRRRPFIAAGSLVLAALYILLWMPCVFGWCDEELPNICVADLPGVGAAGVFFLVLYCVYYCLGRPGSVKRSLAFSIVNGFLYGGFARAHRVLSGPFRRFPARAVAIDLYIVPHEALGAELTPIA